MPDLIVEVQYAADGYAAGATDVPSRQELETWARGAVTEADTGSRTRCAMVIRVVDEVEGADLNRRYRDREGPTNVLSFPFDPPVLPDPDAGSSTEWPDDALDWIDAQIGDLVICAPVVAREAAEQQKSPRAHWAHMVVHGVLHLLGYDHRDPDEASRMEGLETTILRGLGFPPPYEVIEDTDDK